MKGAVREVLEALIMAVMTFLILQASVQNFKVVGSSMEPSLQNGQHLLVNKAVYMRINLARLGKVVPQINRLEKPALYPFNPPLRGDMVVFFFPECHPNRDCVKRVIGVPGDSVEVREGVVLLNGVQLDSPTTHYPMPFPNSSVTLGMDEYYVLGDNLMVSRDSRYWGPLPLESIKGKVWTTYWPLRKFEMYLAPMAFFR